ncbi:head GIN domain-containing protein [Chitinophaga japonensis]|nr:head GIN domain-containing protein [Chitinophaga japonensis]
MQPTYQLLVLLVFSLFTASCDVTGQNHVRGSGNVQKEERSVGAFTKLSVRGSMDVFLTQGPAKAAVIEADDNILPLIELEKEGDELVVRLRRHTSINTRKAMKVYLTTPEIEGLYLAGSGNIKLENKFSNNREMKLKVSGSGNIDGELNAPQVDADISGSGDITLRGETKELDIDIAGSGDFKGSDLLSENADIKIAGSGDALVHASMTLDARIAGSGDVRYKGTPQVSSKVAGSGSVKKD